MYINILFETKDFIALIKPPNIPVQPSRSGQPCLLSHLEDYLEFKRGIDEPFVGLVHRLDQPTGGLILFAKTKDALSSLSKLFQQRKVSKKYLAVVSGTIDQGGELIHYLSADTRKNIVDTTSEPKSGYKKAVLDFIVKKNLTINGIPATVVEIDLGTGRQHQIRAQFSAIGHGLIGDHKYGVLIDHMPLMLWSYKMSFTYKGELYQLEAPVSASPMATYSN